MSFMGNMLGNKALAAHGKGDYKKALEIYEQAYEKGMDKFRLLRGYCVLLIRASQFDKALEVLWANGEDAVVLGEVIEGSEGVVFA